MLGLPALSAPIVLGLVLWAQKRFGGWDVLADAWPDPADRGEPLGMVTGQSFRLKGLALNGILTAAVFEKGLRLSVERPFAWAFRPAFVPWGALQVTRRRVWYGPRATLRLADGTALSCDGRLADRLWRRAPGRWPEAGPAPAPERAADVARHWAVRGGVALGVAGLIGAGLAVWAGKAPDPGTARALGLAAVVAPCAAAAGLALRIVQDHRQGD